MKSWEYWMNNKETGVTKQTNRITTHSIQCIPKLETKNSIQTIQIHHQVHPHEPTIRTSSLMIRE